MPAPAPTRAASAGSRAPPSGCRSATAGSTPAHMHLVVHALADRAAALGELARVLGPGGRLAIATFAPEHFDRFFLNPYFPSLADIDRAPVPRSGGPCRRRHGGRVRGRRRPSGSASRSGQSRTTCSSACAAATSRRCTCSTRTSTPRAWPSSSATSRAGREAFAYSLEWALLTAVRDAELGTVPASRGLSPLLVSPPEDRAHALGEGGAAAVCGVADIGSAGAQHRLRDPAHRHDRRGADERDQPAGELRRRPRPRRPSGAGSTAARPAGGGGWAPCSTGSRAARPPSSPSTRCTIVPDGSLQRRAAHVGRYGSPQRARSRSDVNAIPDQRMPW